MPNARTYEYLVLQYMPNIASGEFINCAVLLFQRRPSDGSKSFCGIRVLQDWSALERLDENVDVELVRSIVQDTGRRVGKALEDCSGSEQLPLLLQEIDSWSNGVVSTPPAELVTEDPEASLCELDRVYLRQERITVTSDAAKRERRKAERTLCHITLQVKTHGSSGKRSVSAVCLDVSESGVAFETEADLTVGDTVELEFSQNDQPPSVQQARLAYRLGLRYGAYFSEPRRP
jgi:Protein of unknown function (DUF3037)/PilZ domain